MGVHDGNYKKAKAALGIPEDEPVFIIRAQDALSVPAIARYHVLAVEAECEPAFQRGINEVMDEFVAWQDGNTATVKIPD